MEEYRSKPLDLRIEDEPRVFKGDEVDRYNVESACLPPNFDPKGVKYDEVISYKVSFAGPDDGRVYAWVARPRRGVRCISTADLSIPSLPHTRPTRHIFAGAGRIRRLSPFPVTDTTGGRPSTVQPIAGLRRCYKGAWLSF